jgi:hypothetical protein
MDCRLRQIAIFGLLAGLIATPALAQNGRAVDPAASGETAVLRALDKVTTRRTDLEVPVGESVSFGTLEISVDYCRTRPPEEKPESFVLLTVTEKDTNEQAVVVFDGWMLASLPGLNPLEHPVYDLWAIGCRMKPAAGAQDGGSDGKE